LTQIQDIAGCRLVVDDLAAQDRVVEQLRGVFETTTVVDRRGAPSHGYRAVHVIVLSSNKLIEIQLRTALQHMWAEVSEKFSDVVDAAIKYGGGPERIRSLLIRSSDVVSKQEWLEEKTRITLEEVRPGASANDALNEKIAATAEGLRSDREAIVGLLQDAIKLVETAERGGSGVLSD
jgi:ppGpp synthetase/RelA/SpoT-type nucleotidyltranferase